MVLDFILRQAQDVGHLALLPHCNPTPTLVIYEQLRQERQVADILGLTEDEIEDHFAGNARRFLAQMRQGRNE